MSIFLSLSTQGVHLHILLESKCSSAFLQIAPYSRDVGDSLVQAGNKPELLLIAGHFFFTKEASLVGLLE
jgi:hypothetical protein